MSSHEIEIEMNVQDVDSFLQSELSEEQYAALVITRKNPTSTSMPGRDRGIDPDTINTIVNFSAAAIAGGALYDCVKLAIQKLADKSGDDDNTAN